MGLDGASPNHALGYPNSYLYAVRHYESLLIDKEGGFDSYPTFTGTVKEFGGGNTGGFISVQGDNEERYFVWNVRLLVKGNGSWTGSKVTIYYELDEILDAMWALKVVIHE